MTGTKVSIFVVFALLIIAIIANIFTIKQIYINTERIQTLEQRINDIGLVFDWEGEKVK